MITKYGYSTVGLIAIIVFILIVIAIFINNSFAKYAIISLSVIFLLFSLYFFRDPFRNTPFIDKAVFSPADGKIIFIGKVREEDFFSADVWKISIFMSPLNVHVNRIPMKGTIKYLKYNKGEFSAAFLDKASEKNERMQIGLETAFGKIKFVQIAGAIARRIVCNLNLEQQVTAGEKFGMIKFGSRVDVYLPLNTSIRVKLDEKVYSGNTILAEFN